MGDEGGNTIGDRLVVDDQMGIRVTLRLSEEARLSEQPITVSEINKEYSILSDKLTTVFLLL